MCAVKEHLWHGCAAAAVGVPCGVGGWAGGWRVWAAPTQAAGLTPPLPRASPPPGHAGGCASINAAPRPVPLPCLVPAELLPLLLRHVLQLPGPALRDGHRQHAPRNHAGGLPRSECRDSWRRGRGSGSQNPDGSSQHEWLSHPAAAAAAVCLRAPPTPCVCCPCLAHPFCPAGHLPAGGEQRAAGHPVFFLLQVCRHHPQKVQLHDSNHLHRWVAMWVAMWVGGWVHQAATSDPPHTQPASCLPTPNPALCLNPPARPPLTAPPQA